MVGSGSAISLCLFPEHQTRTSWWLSRLLHLWLNCAGADEAALLAARGVSWLSYLWLNCAGADDEAALLAGRGISWLLYLWFNCAGADEAALLAARVVSWLLYLWLTCAGADEATLLAARGVSWQHALTHRPPDPRHEHHPALHEGQPASRTCNTAVLKLRESLRNIKKTVLNLNPWTIDKTIFLGNVNVYFLAIISLFFVVEKYHLYPRYKFASKIWFNIPAQFYLIVADEWQLDSSIYCHLHWDV